MSDLEIVLLVGLALGVTLGPLTARSSARREKIYGGAPAKTLHLIASGLFVATPPTVLVGAIAGLGLKTLFPLAFSVILSSLGILIVFAIFEKQAKPAVNPQVDRGWTAEDARKSGL